MRKHVKNLLPGKSRFRGARVHRLIGEKFFAREVWHITRRSISGGLALGLFIAFTPTIPFQMLIAALAAIKLRINLPTALAACWVSNPVTAVPVYGAAYRFGRYVLGSLPFLFTSSAPEQTSATRLLFIRASYLWCGSLLFAAMAGVGGYVFIQVAWRVVTLRAWHRRAEKRRRKKLHASRNSSSSPR